jgi:hypothetical protein
MTQAEREEAVNRALAVLVGITPDDWRELREYFPDIDTQTAQLKQRPLHLTRVYDGYCTDCNGPHAPQTPEQV